MKMLCCGESPERQTIKIGQKNIYRITCLKCKHREEGERLSEIFKLWWGWTASRAARY